MIWRVQSTFDRRDCVAMGAMSWGLAVALTLACMLVINADAGGCQARNRLQGRRYDLEDGVRLVVADGCSFTVIHSRQGSLPIQTSRCLCKHTVRCLLPVSFLIEGLTVHWLGTLM